MTLQDVISEIKLELTGNLLDIEIEDTTIEQVIKKALREIERYWDETQFITVPFASCIDLNGFETKSSAIIKVYRTSGYGEAAGSINVMTDPLYAQQYLMFSNGGSMYNLNDYLLNFASWSTMNQVKNTLSTDLAFREDKHNNKLYINHYLDRPINITIEYVPKLTGVEQIQSDYWIDILIKISTALTKVIIGRIRTRFTQNNALWNQDGEKLLEEGTTELKELREILRTNSNLIVGID